MIYDKIENLKLYYSLNPHFEQIADFIANNDLAAMECGSYEVAPGVKAGISEYEPGSGSDFEAHREYHDLQYAVSGEETIEVIPTEFAENSKGYTPDIEFFTSQKCESTKVSLVQGTFAFLAPGDAHKPCVKLGSDKIKKVVFKIKI
ncbi:MAG: YhcH/YjgK/YiaL family protein [Oscillospiraceae bacterium]|nr:YhcH/YjgK/YiaL family protein [Oscillospiraceae bacterium]